MYMKAQASGWCVGAVVVVVGVVDGVEGAAGPPAEAAPWYPAALPGPGLASPWTRCAVAPAPTMCKGDQRPCHQSRAHPM